MEPGGMSEQHDSTVLTATTEKEEPSSSKHGTQKVIAKIAGQHGIDYLIHPQEPHSLQERFDKRQQKEHLLEQENLERITKQAFDSGHSEKSGEPDPDWLSHFFSIAKRIRNPSMQRLWSRILKQECLLPGSISIKTLDTLRAMTHKEAQIFLRACTLTCYFGGDKSKKILTSLIIRHKLLPSLLAPATKKLTLGHFQLPYSDILILMELGLVLKTELESGEFAPQTPLTFSYQTHHYRLIPQQKGCSFTYYRLTPTGQELAELLGSKTHEPFRESLMEMMHSHFLIESDH